MYIQAGLVLYSLSSLRDDYFYETLVYIVELNADGALGFVINRPFPRRLSELAEFARLPPFPLYEGGPVDEAHLYFVHRCPGKVEGGAAVADGVYFGGNFGQVVKGIEKGRIAPGEVRIFVGYCGWNAGDLEKEIKQGGWELRNGSPFL